MLLKFSTMNENEKTDGHVFFGQWTKFKRLSWCLTFKESTCTVPDQSMSIQEIIAKYTRTGLVPASYLHKDEGGNAAFDPDFDPLDEGREVLEAAQDASAGSSDGSPAEPSGEPEDKRATAGEGSE